MDVEYISLKRYTILYIHERAEARDTIFLVFKFLKIDRQGRQFAMQVKFRRETTEQVMLLCDLESQCELYEIYLTDRTHYFIVEHKINM